jgi:hypothetical protein
LAVAQYVSGHSNSAALRGIIKQNICRGRDRWISIYIVNNGVAGNLARCPESNLDTF